MEKALNGQFREFIGKLLVKGSDEKVALIDKTKIQNAINSLSSNKDTVFENLIHFINNGCRLVFDGFISKLFQKTNIIKVVKNPNSFMIEENSVKTFLSNVIKREKDLQNPDPYVDDDLWNYFAGKSTHGFSEDFETTVYRFTKNLTHQQILNEAENIGIKKVYSYLEGLSIVRQAVLNGEVDKKGTGIIVYFNNLNDVLCRFRFYVYRNDDSQLYVRVDMVRPDNGGDVGDGACFIN